MWKVTYLGFMGKVTRTFYTKNEAQEFIDINACVYPLPCVRLIDCRSFSEMLEDLDPDRRDCLLAKLTSAVATALVVDNDYQDSIDAGDESWETYDRMMAIRDMRDELTDLRSYV